jgi:hypothetical protein
VVALSVVLVIWVLGCLAAGWWQATRAMDGNALSYLYAIEWPIFAVAGVVIWWLVLHTAPVTEDEREERKAYEAARRATRLAEHAAPTPSGEAPRDAAGESAPARKSS